MHKKILAGLAAGFIAAVGFAVPAQAISATTADLYVLHAVPGTPVDVYVNGDLTLEDFQPEDLAGPLDLPVGDYEVVVTAAGDPITSPAIGPATFSLAANTSYTVVAHLAADDSLTASAFVNDLSAIPAGQGKVTVRHTAGAPEVDILAGGARVDGLSPIVNGAEKKATLPTGTISVAVAAAGTTVPVIGPADLTVREGVNTVVYAWGSLDADNLGLLFQTFEGLHSAPGGVNSGQAGLAADLNPTVLGVTAAGILALLAAAAVTVFRVRAVRAER